MLSALVEEYEKEVCPIQPPTLSEILKGKKDPTYKQAQKNFLNSQD